MNLITKGLGELQSIITRGLGNSSEEPTPITPTVSNGTLNKVFSWPGHYQQQTITYELQAPIKQSDRTEYFIEQPLRNQEQSILNVAAMLVGRSTQEFAIQARKNPERLLNLLEV